MIRPGHVSGCEPFSSPSPPCSMSVPRHSTPKGTDQEITSTATAVKVLPIAAKHTAQLYLSGSLTLLALGALAVSYPAIATLVRERGSVIATVAALLGGIGAFCGALLNVLVGVNLAAAAAAHLTPDAAARFLVTTFTSRPGELFTAVYFIGITAAPVLMGFALWRSRSVPRWLAVLFVIGLEVAQQVVFGPVRVVLFMLPFAVAMVALGARIWQAAAWWRSPGREPAACSRMRRASSQEETAMKAIVQDTYGMAGEVRSCHRGHRGHRGLGKATATGLAALGARVGRPAGRAGLLRAARLQPVEVWPT